MLATILSVNLGKAIYYLTRLTKKGGGSAAPGLYALKTDPHLISRLSADIPQNIVITGTNGKTTTSRMLSHFLEIQNISLLRNATGSNLARGVASALISKANSRGKIKGVDAGIWELDEAAFNSVVFAIKPQIIVFLNAFRDQLDRYGEVDTVVRKWEETLSKIDWNPLVIINADDINTSKLSSVENLSVVGFSVSGIHKIGEKGNKVKGKPVDILYAAKLLKPKGMEGSEIELSTPSGSQKMVLPLPGTYHIYDLLASFSIYYNLNLPLDTISQSLESFSPAFGRVEKLKINNTQCYIFLIKNPAGSTEVFRTISPELKKEDKVLLTLNDNFADGQDVSWIWDAEFERLKSPLPIHFIVSGLRAFDLALRLKYAGINPININIEPDLHKALLDTQKSAEGRLFILPTYTALLQLQKSLAQLKVKKQYWMDK